MNKTAYLTILLIIFIAAIFGVAARVKHSQGSSAATMTVDEMTDGGTSTPEQPIDFKNAHYEFLADSFDLANGHALLRGYASGTQASWTDSQGMHAETKGPVSYTFSASSNGAISTSGERGSAVILSRGSGANLIRLVLFAFADASGTPVEVATSTLIEGDAKVQSLIVDGGIITANFLVVSEADKRNLPHYEEAPTEPETLRFRLEGGNLLPVAED